MTYIYVLLLLFTYCTKYVYPHGAMVLPNTWQQKLRWEYKDGKWVQKYLGIESGKQCSGGAWINTTKLCPGGPDRPGQPVGCGNSNAGGACFWFNDNTTIPGKPTIVDRKYRTYDIDDHYPSRFLLNPWRAPGTAPVDSPCGVAGGNYRGCNGKKCPPNGGYAYGPKAESFDFSSDNNLFSFYLQPKVTNWERGSIQETAWGITANHGGGYSYRLCKIPTKGVSGITEECFQKAQLDFVGDKQWIQWGEDEQTRIEIKATRTTVRTYPKDSMWTKNPIPACIGTHHAGGLFDPTFDCPLGTQFKPPRQDLKGYGINIHNTSHTFMFAIIDRVQVPNDLETGKYVLSWRWDCEQSPQVWNTCAFIQIKDAPIVIND